MNNNYIEKSERYIKGVLDDKIPANKYVKLACERQLKDLSRKDFDYYFDREAACRISNSLSF